MAGRTSVLRARRRFLPVALAVCAALVLAGCTSVIAGSPTIAGGPPSSPADQTPPSQTPPSDAGTTAPSTKTSPLASTSPTAPTTGSGSEPTSSAPVTTSVGAPLLGVTDGYEVFARSPTAVARFALAHGLITTTSTPGVPSGAGAYFIVGSHAVMARPWDYVQGFLLPDGGPAAPLPGDLAGGGGYTFPGPEPDQVWVEDTSNGTESGVVAMHLVGFDGEPTQASIPMDGPPLAPDGAGGVLVQTDSGIDDVGPHDRTQILSGTGTVLAVGPSGWVIRSCDDDDDCDQVYVDRAGGSLRSVSLGGTPSEPGVISPDGTMAAIIATSGTAAEIIVADLSTGDYHVLGLPSDAVVDKPSHGAALAWSPDSQWLFAAVGPVLAINGATGQAQPLPGVPDRLKFFQVGIRPAS